MKYCRAQVIEDAARAHYQRHRASIGKKHLAKFDELHPDRRALQIAAMEAAFAVIEAQPWAFSRSKAESIPIASAGGSLRVGDVVTFAGVMRDPWWKRLTRRLGLMKPLKPEVPKKFVITSTMEC